MKDHIKTIVKPVNIFDEMDINYWGPFDGHNTEELENVFELAKKYDRPVLLHVVTVKGKGSESGEGSHRFPRGFSARPKEPCETGRKSWSEIAAGIVLGMAERTAGSSVLRRP